MLIAFPQIRWVASEQKNMRRQILILTLASAIATLGTKSQAAECNSVLRTGEGALGLVIGAAAISSGIPAIQGIGGVAGILILGDGVLGVREAALSDSCTDFPILTAARDLWENHSSIFESPATAKHEARANETRSTASRGRSGR